MMEISLKNIATDAPLYLEKSLCMNPIALREIIPLISSHLLISFRIRKLPYSDWPSSRARSCSRACFTSGRSS